jgi:hypothetical protein
MIRGFANKASGILCDIAVAIRAAFVANLDDSALAKRLGRLLAHVMASLTDKPDRVQKRVIGFRWYLQFLSSLGFF